MFASLATLARSQLCVCVQFFFVIERRTRDLIYLKFVATDFYLKLQYLVGNSEETQCLEISRGSVDIPYPPLQIVNSIPFCLFSHYLYPLSAPFLNPLSSPSLPSLLSLNSSKNKTSIYYILFNNGTYFCILFHNMTF